MERKTIMREELERFAASVLNKPEDNRFTSVGADTGEESGGARLEKSPGVAARR